MAKRKRTDNVQAPLRRSERLVERAGIGHLREPVSASSLPDDVQIKVASRLSESNDLEQVMADIRAFAGTDRRFRANLLVSKVAPLLDLGSVANRLATYVLKKYEIPDASRHPTVLGQVNSRDYVSSITQVAPLLSENTKTLLHQAIMKLTDGGARLEAMMSASTVSFKREENVMQLNDALDIYRREGSSEAQRSAAAATIHAKRSLLTDEQKLTLWNRQNEHPVQGTRYYQAVVDWHHDQVLPLERPAPMDGETPRQMLHRNVKELKEDAEAFIAVGHTYDHETQVDIRELAERLSQLGSIAQEQARMALREDKATPGDARARNDRGRAPER